MEKDSLETNIEIIKERINMQVACMQSHIKHFEKHLDKDDTWRAHVEKEMRTCPESGHILIQNGKIDRLTSEVSRLSNEVSSTHGSVKLWCYIFAALIASLTIGAFVSGIINKSEKQCVVKQVKRGAYDNTSNTHSR